VRVEAVAELLERDVVAHALRAGLVLRVDAVPVAAVGPLPAVVVDEAAVDLAVGPRREGGDALPRIVDDEVDEPDPGARRRAAVDAVAAADVPGPRARLGGEPVRVGAHDLEVLVPGVGPGDREDGAARRVAAVERGALADGLTDDDRQVRRPGQ